MDHGVVVDEYIYENGFFRAKACLHYIYEHVHTFYYCGVNAHHNNIVTEHSIRTVSECTWSLLIHSSTLWKSVTGASVHAPRQRNNMYVQTVRRYIYKTGRLEHPQSPIRQYK